MDATVIVPPDPIVSVGEIGGHTSCYHWALAGMIAAAQEQIDGPGGILGRSLGPQTLEAYPDCWGDRSIRLPYKPIIGIVSVKYLDADGDEQTVDSANYALTGDLLWFKPAFGLPAYGAFEHPIRVRYRAGYNGATGASEGEVQTGLVPERARQAIILSVQQMSRLNAADVFMTRDEVEGVGVRQFSMTQAGSDIVKQASDRLLSTLVVF